MKCKDEKERGIITAVSTTGTAVRYPETAVPPRETAPVNAETAIRNDKTGAPKGVSPVLNGKTAVYKSKTSVPNAGFAKQIS